MSVHTASASALKRSMEYAGIGAARLASEAGVDERTVKRWLAGTNAPKSETARRAAAVLKRQVSEIWPQYHDARPAVSVAHIYAARRDIEDSVWSERIEQAQQSIDLHSYSLTFLMVLVPNLAERLQARASAGVKVRVCIADPKGKAVRLRDSEEGGSYIRKLAGAAVDLFGCPASSAFSNYQVRLHDCVVYASLLRFDADLFANTHVWGSGESQNPVLHLEGSTNPLFMHFINGFEKVWENAKEVS